ncbi:hypothetical protein DH2020_000325 [Rehmannia glutinosa]|uniref:Uncharacterized protein n=1 Tax=Rehmannia glutinosa TaxID=99300 RepID=A0ABR0XW72_REHGL
MPGFTCKRALHRANCFGLNYYFHLPKIHFLGLNLFSSAPRDAVKPSSKNANEDSFAVNYLIDVHGFSRASALKASQVLHIKSSKKPDVVIALFKSFGLNDSYISSMFRKRPILLQFTKEKLMEKIEFFKSLGFSSSEIPRVLAAGDVLLASLKTKTIPSYNFLKNLFASDKDLLRCVKGYPLILASPRTLAANIQTLRHVGLPDSNIAYMVRHNPRAMLVSCHKFSEAVTEAENIGFNPLRISFVKGIWALNNCKSTWKEKMEEYKRWGMSEDEVLATFRKYPWFMITSADKIRRVFELLVNEMGQTYSIVMKRPPIVSLSIEKRIFPRCTVYQFLLSKDLVKPNGLGQMLVCTEEMFLKKYVKIYKEEAPEILKLYHERLGLSKRVDCKND